MIVKRELLMVRQNKMNRKHVKNNANYDAMR